MALANLMNISFDSQDDDSDYLPSDNSNNYSDNDSTNEHVIANEQVRKNNEGCCVIL
jgi:hypothetical protein